MPDDPQPPRINPTPAVRPPRREDPRIPGRRQPRQPRKPQPTRDPRRHIDEYAHP